LAAAGSLQDVSHPKTLAVKTKARVIAEESDPIFVYYLQEIEDRASLEEFNREFLRLVKGVASPFDEIFGGRRER